MKVRIRPVASRDEEEALFRFRFRIYVEEMGRRQTYADYANRIIRDPLDDRGYNFVALDGGDIVGCVRVNLPRDGSVGEYHELFGIGEAERAASGTTSLCTRLMIAPGWRGTTLATRLLVTAYDFGLVNGVRSNFVDCNDHLISFFEKFGCRRLRRANHRDYGRINVMRLDLLDEAHLAACRSPLLRSLHRFRAGERAAA